MSVSPRRRWYHVRWWIAAAPVAAYLLLLGMLMPFEESMIFFPFPYPEGDWSPPELEIEDAWFEAADGVRLHGWYVPHESPRAVMLFAHGNAGNITHRIDHLRFLNQLRVSVLVFDYRGYGRSQGRPNEAGVLADARAARRWLAERANVAEQEIVLLGESIGGAVAVDLASKDGARGLILESTFSSLPEVAAYHYRIFPVRLLMRSRFDALSKITEYHGPLLMCHGEADTIIPFELGQRLFHAANEPKRFVQLAGHDHNDPLPRTWYQAIDQFIAELERASEARIRKPGPGEPRE
jgi:fermentation-respiration switch protein FrsA (DUF1100 family)